MIIEGNRAVVEEHMLNQAGSLGELMEQFQNRIPPVLIGGAGRDKLLERARGLPVSLGVFGFGFELPLHVPEPRADLGVALFAGRRSAAHFAEWCRSQPADSSTAGALGILREMEQEDSDLGRIAEHKLLLEYDIDPASRGAQPVPGIFLYPSDDALPGDGSARRREDLGLVADAVAAAGGRKLHAAERRQFERVFLAMPPHARVGSVGVFPDRGNQELRLGIMGFRKIRELTAFLERAGWPGSVAPLVFDLEQRGAFAHLGVHFDIQADGVGPLLGVDFYARDARWIKDAQPWMALIDGFREQDLAVREKLDTLAKRWSGAEMLFGRRGVLLLVRGIHHFKLVLAGDRCEQVKAYVFFMVLAPPPTAATT